MNFDICASDCHSLKTSGSPRPPTHSWWLPNGLRAEEDRDFGVSAKTVGEVRKATTWPGNLRQRQETNRESAVKVSRANGSGRVSPDLSTSPVFFIPNCTVGEQPCVRNHFNRRRSSGARGVAQENWRDPYAARFLLIQQHAPRTAASHLK